MSDVVPIGPGDPWQLRASDADRDAYLKVLQDAYLEGRISKPEYDERMSAALQGQTYGELRALLHDLPVPPDLPGPPVVLPRPASLAATEVSGATAQPLLALFAETSRDARWVVPDDQVAVAAFGSVKIDLTDALLSGFDTEIKANAIFGEVVITVPDDLDVEVNGTGIFGEFNRKDKRSKTRRNDPVGGPARPRIRVTGVALFGAVNVRIVEAPATPPDRLLPGNWPPPAIEG